MTRRSVAVPSLATLLVCAGALSFNHGPTQSVAQAASGLNSASVTHSATATDAAHSKSPRVHWEVNRNTSSSRSIYGKTTRPQDRALAYLRHRGADLGISAGVVEQSGVPTVHALRSGGSIVQYRQELDGVEVYGARLSLLLDRDGEVMFTSGNLLESAHKPRSNSFPLGAEQATQHALSEHFAVPFGTPSLNSGVTPRSRGEFSAFQFSSLPASVTFDTPTRARQIYYSTNDGTLEPAYHVEFIGSSAGVDQAYAILVSAQDGRELYKKSLLHNDTFSYRVWAEAQAPYTPMDGPNEDVSPHPTGVYGAVVPSPIDANLIEVEGLNTNPEGGSDPWLLPGATETQGNNVNAYSDRDQINADTGTLNDGFTAGDLRGDTTSTNTFDHPYDHTLAPDATDAQIKAAVTQIFYTTNWLHDYWYDSGFDEQSGVAQTDNYGRGGVDADALRAEAQDSANEGTRNNANMATPSDGISPRMQMYVWQNRDANRGIAVSPDISTLSGGSQISQFSETDFDVRAEVVLASDTEDPVTDGCETTTQDLTGKILVVEAGAGAEGLPKCRGVQRASIAEEAGAVGLLFVAADDVPPGLGLDPNFDTDLPALSIPKADGDAIIKQLQDGETTEIRLLREGQADLDGTIDNQIVAHEWGHYLHLRMVLCGANSCGAMSEGWGDFIALHMALREGDALGGVYPIAAYPTPLISPDSYYFGLRRYPYSTNKNKNPLTFGHLSNAKPLPAGITALVNGQPNAESHNAGEVWATIMHQAQTELLKASRGDDARLSWDEAHRRMADYMVAGMKLAPVEPSFVEQRDAILVAALQNDVEDFKALAKGFSDRGLGSCAISPPTSSADYTETVESFEAGGNLQFLTWSLTDTGNSCDDDGRLDSGESGTLLLTIANTGFETLSATDLTLTSPSDFIEIENGSVALPDLEPFLAYEIEVPVAITMPTNQPQDIEFNLQMDNDISCAGAIKVALQATVNADAVEGLTEDTVEAETSSFVQAQAELGQVDMWGITEYEQHDRTNRRWHGLDAGALSDSSLFSPALAVSEDEDFVFTVDHTFSFETSPEEAGSTKIIYWDGAVIEYSTDEGASWTDVSELTDPGYNSLLADWDESPNPLKQREGFGETNPSYPNSDELVLDFGKQLAGESVILRFRIGTDAAASDQGWFLDNFKATGITNAPFVGIGEDNCRTEIEPIYTIDTSSDATGSTSQTSTTSDVADIVDSIETTAPESTEDSEVESSNDSTSVNDTLIPEDDGCGCSTSSNTGPLGWVMALFLAIPWLRRRREGIA